VVEMEVEVKVDSEMLSQEVCSNFLMFTFPIARDGRSCDIERRHRFRTPGPRFETR
jgi:hypothetical protein